MHPESQLKAPPENPCVRHVFPPKLVLSHCSPRTFIFPSPQYTLCLNLDQEKENHPVIGLESAFSETEFSFGFYFSNQLPKIDAEIKDAESTQTNDRQTRIKLADFFINIEEREKV